MRAGGAGNKLAPGNACYEDLPLPAELEALRHVDVDIVPVNPDRECPQTGPTPGGANTITRVDVVAPSVPRAGENGPGDQAVIDRVSDVQAPVLQGPEPHGSVEHRQVHFAETHWPSTADRYVLAPTGTMPRHRRALGRWAASREPSSRFERTALHFGQPTPDAVLLLGADGVLEARLADVATGTDRLSLGLAGLPVVFSLEMRRRKE